MSGSITLLPVLHFIYHKIIIDIFMCNNDHFYCLYYNVLYFQNKLIKNTNLKNLNLKY